MVSQTEDIKSITLFKALKEIYMYYLKHIFHITTLHVDVKFSPLQELIQEMPGGPRVNLSSASEHVTEIERRIQ